MNFIRVFLGAHASSVLTVSALTEHASCVRSQGRPWRLCGENAFGCGSAALFSSVVSFCERFCSKKSREIRGGLCGAILFSRLVSRLNALWRKCWNRTGKRTVYTNMGVCYGTCF